MIVEISIDTSTLSFPLFLVPGQPFPDPGRGEFQAGGPIDLPPGSHHFQQFGGSFADFTFLVTETGTVDFDDAFDSFLSGRGTTTLQVGGFPVEVDGTELSHGLLPVIAGSVSFLMPDRVHTLTLVPESHYLLQPTSGVVASFEFAVNLTGLVILDAGFTGFAVATGNRLTVTGYRITVDGRTLSHDLLPALVSLRNDFLPRGSVNTLTLIPAAGYVFQPGSGIVADFTLTVGVDGTTDFPADCDGFLTGRGTTRIVIGGYPVLLDAGRADSALLSIGNIGLPADSARFLLAVLVPAPNYVPQTVNGVFGHGFTVHRDGTITVDPAATGTLLISTVPRVEIVGSTPV